LTAQLSKRTDIAILPISNRKVVAGGPAYKLASEAATLLNARGFKIRLLTDTRVSTSISRLASSNSELTASTIGDFATTIGVGAVVVLALSEASQTASSITTSIYSSIGGVFEEVWKKRVGWHEETSSDFQPGCTGNLLTNGDFERDWDIGWTRKYGDIQQGSSITEVIEASNSHVLHIKHTGKSDVSLFQIVDVPKGNLIFQFEAKFQSWEGPIIGFSGTGIAGISIVLFDEQGKQLGLLWAGNYVKNPFADTPLLGVPRGPSDTHISAFYTLPKGQTVKDRINLTKIIRDRLGGIDVDLISKVAVVLSVGATDSRAGSEAWIDNLYLEVCPIISAAELIATPTKDRQDLIGTWEGRGCQSNGSCWSIHISIPPFNDDATGGTIAYPSLNCEAKLEFVRWEGNTAVFRERYIKKGRCVTDGWLRLTPLDSGRVQFIWAWPDGRKEAWTEISRVSR
jgi:hypothetical protein